MCLLPLPIFGPPCPMINDWGLRNNNYRWPGELCLLGFRPWGAYFCHYRFPDLIIWIIRNGFITQHNVKVATSLGEVKGWITSVNPIHSWLGDKRSGKQKSKSGHFKVNLIAISNKQYLHVIELQTCLNEFIWFCKDTIPKCYPDAECEYCAAVQVCCWEWEYESSVEMALTFPGQPC